jgi:hypothetical protein
VKVHVLGIDQISLILYHYSQPLSKRQGGTLARSTEEGICEHFTATACEAYTAALPRVKLDTARLSEVFTSTVNLPIELHVTPPEYFLLVDSGANIQALGTRSF